MSPQHLIVPGLKFGLTSFIFYSCTKADAVRLERVQFLWKLIRGDHGSPPALQEARPCSALGRADYSFCSAHSNSLQLRVCIATHRLCFFFRFYSVEPYSSFYMVCYLTISFRFLLLPRRFPGTGQKTVSRNCPAENLQGSIKVGNFL